jgi:hypothetical protein
VVDGAFVGVDIEWASGVMGSKGEAKTSAIPRLRMSPIAVKMTMNTYKRFLCDMSVSFQM